jgi:DNA topoisomerase-1
MVKMANKKAPKSTKKRSGSTDAAGRQLVVVESPAKARTINKYLGKDYIVMASVGHVRDLPTKNPKGVKDAVPGVDLEHDFQPTYEIIKGKQKAVTDLKKAAKKAAGVWLATDLDREGEAIAWHLMEALGVKTKDTYRVVFNAITKSEIEKAFQHPRTIDMKKVNAQQARRILDRIVGYQVSPLLWKKVAGGLSAGRVQSVAVRLLVEREREIDAFVPQEYWKVTGYFTTLLEKADLLGREWRQWLAAAPESGNGNRANGRKVAEKNAWLAEHESFAGELIEVDGKRFKPRAAEEVSEILSQVGFQLDEKIETENPKAKGPARRVTRLHGHVGEGRSWQVKSVETKRTKSRPAAPFITSTLQQTAANRLDFSAQNTMRLAQSLYEGVEIGSMGSVGLITYMRTDSTHLSGEAIKMARDFIASQFGKDYLPPRANVFSSSNKAAQEAHEAIRPTDLSLTPTRVRSSLTEQQYKLYKLIWERFVACQMTEALWDATTVLISVDADGNEVVFRATGRILVFDGYYKVVGLPNTSEEPTLPSLTESQVLAAIQIDPTQHFTLPPPRYTEASLIKKLESEGIGRPSTYAQIIQVIQDRKYVEKNKNRFGATDLGKVVNDKLVEAFPDILEVGYTRDMEQQLDDIEEKQADWVNMLQRFYGGFKESLDTAYKDMQHAKAETQPAPHSCPECQSATVYRFGRNGRFLSCSKYPACKYAAPIDSEGRPVAPEQTDMACPKCGGATIRRKGRFGPFLSCSRYPDCDGVLNLDSKGAIVLPKAPPLRTEIACPKCEAPLNLRRGARGPWLSCSTFPKCRGRLGWTKLEAKEKNHWLKALDEHEKAHPQPVIRRIDGTPIEEGSVPETRDIANTESNANVSKVP